ncbi:hypothetical protein ACHAXT_006361 [Thalassiosira profunda]
MAPVPARTGAHDEVVVSEENGAGDARVKSPAASGATPTQLCFVDADGRVVELSSTKQCTHAISLLEDNLDQSRKDDNDNMHNFSTRTNASQQASLDEVKRFELFRTVVQHEDDLLNQRVSWIILAQSFLMAAFITNTSEDGNGDALKYIAACVGLLTVIVTLPAIFAAGRNIELQQKVYFAGISSDERCRELHGHGRDILKGHRNNKRHERRMKEEQRERLEHGHTFPNMAFRGRGGVPILFTVSLLAVVQVLGWILLLFALVRGW